MGATQELARPAGIRRSATYLYEIESLRGIAMLLVFVFHVNAHVMGPMPASEPAGLALEGRVEPDHGGPGSAITVVSLGISQLTYRLIERPFLTRKARIE